MQVPLLYADAVIGTNGSTISYIRRASGATITIQETRGVPGEMTVEINGTASQVQAAQQLIQVMFCNDLFYLFDRSLSGRFEFVTLKVCQITETTFFAV